MFEKIEKLMYMGVGAFSMTRRKAEKLAEKMVDQGKVNAEKGGEFVDSMMSWASKEKTALEEYIQKTVKSAINSTGLVTKCQYDALLKRIEALENEAKKDDDKDSDD